ncbi:MAG TPA: DUF1961 family protein [Planctomycetota bacterium]|nr:DUF1961 family protein [Planctomycetota bacterium]
MAADVEKGSMIYENRLERAADVKAWRMEGDGVVRFSRGRMHLENARDPSEGQQANFVFWCDFVFPNDYWLEWDFTPEREPGLAILFFAACGRRGEDVFDPKLKPRNGPYEQYHHGDIDAFHLVYFRRRYPDERAFHVTQLRKSFGFHLVSEGADPIPNVDDATPPYRMRLRKYRRTVDFAIGAPDGAMLPVLSWEDDGQQFGKRLGGGKIAIRQMAPLRAAYANLQAWDLKKV